MKCSATRKKVVVAIILQLATRLGIRVSPSALVCEFLQRPAPWHFNLSTRPVLLMAVVGYPQVTAMFLRAARFGLTGQLSAFWAFRHGSSAQCEGDAFRPKISLSILLKLLLQVFNPTIFVLPDLLWKVCFLLHFAAGVRIGAEPIPGRVHIQSGRTHLIAWQLSGGRYREHWRNHQIAGCLVIAW